MGEGGRVESALLPLLHCTCNNSISRILTDSYVCTWSNTWWRGHFVIGLLLPNLEYRVPNVPSLAASAPALTRSSLQSSG